MATVLNYGPGCVFTKKFGYHDVLCRISWKQALSYLPQEINKQKTKTKQKKKRKTKTIVTSQIDKFKAISAKRCWKFLFIATGIYIANTERKLTASRLPNKYDIFNKPKRAKPLTQHRRQSDTGIVAILHVSFFCRSYMYFICIEAKEQRPP